MRPFNLINIGDIYKRPGQSTEWIVTEKNKVDKMVLIETYSIGVNKVFKIWKSHRDSIFNYKV